MGMEAVGSKLNLPRWILTEKDPLGIKLAQKMKKMEATLAMYGFTPLGRPHIKGAKKKIM